MSALVSWATHHNGAFAGLFLAAAGIGAVIAVVLYAALTGRGRS